jgi:hypothetical protein
VLLKQAEQILQTAIDVPITTKRNFQTTALALAAQQQINIRGSCFLSLLNYFTLASS